MAHLTTNRSKAWAHPRHGEILPLRCSKLGELVQVHLKAFPGFFLSLLGPRFLREFYAAFLVDEGAIAYMALDEQNQVCGSVVGSLRPTGFFKRLLIRRWWAFCLASLGTVLRRPVCIPRLFRAIFYKGEPPPGPSRALLSSIAVLPSAQGRGIGRILVQSWLDEARERGAVGCYLTTDAQNNDAVNSFYVSLGWMLESSYLTPEGRKMNRYIFDFPDFSSSATFDADEHPRSKQTPVARPKGYGI